MENTISLTTVLKGWREMKKWLLVLLVLGLSVPAMAQQAVLVYNLKQSGAEFEYDTGTGAWVKSKSSDTVYLVIQVDSNSPDANIRSIDTWKSGTTKYYTIDSSGTISFLQTLIAKKNMWIFEGTFGDPFNIHIVVAGQAKSITIGTESHTVAATLSGCVIYGNIKNEDVGGGTVSLTLNPTITKALVALVPIDGDVDSAISDYFKNTLHYEPGSD